MTSYVVLARKWRPAQFSDIVGQSHIVRTLMNAIRSERIHQAYLLTGSRGIGKTSIARIFAKAVRCESVSLSEGDSGLRSCDQCPSCKEITTGSGVDVIEIDGASNNGVDAVREIRENAKYLPASGKRKIYIIDEVHMLTTAAFNALLKTLEEPPAHVIFIFATTEPHKIPATILSRCQRFDLKRVTMAQIQTRLAEVTQSEGIKAEPGALALIARAAEGSMRDALSLLDQIIAFAGNQISTQAVRESIGLIEGQAILGILQGIFARKPLEALAIIEQAYQQGHDLRVLCRSLIEFIHAAILSKVSAPPSATLELTEEEKKELASIASLRTLEELELIFQVLHHGMEWIARAPQPKIVLDVLTIKCATAEALVRIEDSGNAPSHASSGQSQARPEPKPVMQTQAPAATPAQSAIQPKPASITPAPIAAPVIPTAAPAPVTVPTASAAPAAASGPKTWEGYINHVRQTRPLLASILENGNCEALPSTADNAVGICFRPQDAYYRDQLQSRVYGEQLMIMGKEYFGMPIRVRVELKEMGESLAIRRLREKEERETAAKSAAQNHPIIREAQALFGGELGPIELLDPRKDEEE